MSRRSFEWRGVPRKRECHDRRARSKKPGCSCSAPWLGPSVKSTARCYSGASNDRGEAGRPTREVPHGDRGGGREALEAEWQAHLKTIWSADFHQAMDDYIDVIVAKIEADEAKGLGGG